MRLQKVKDQDVLNRLNEGSSDSSEQSGYTNPLKNIGSKILSGANDINIGGAKMGRNILRMLHIPGGQSSDQDIESFYGQKEQPSYGHQLLQGLSQHAPAFIVPELKLGRLGEAAGSVPKIGRYLQKSLGAAVPVGAFEATQNNDKPIESGVQSAGTSIPFTALAEAVRSGNPYVKTAALAALSGAGAFGGHEIAKNLGLGGLGATAASLVGALTGLAGKNPTNDARNKMLEGVEGTQYKQKLLAARRLGLSYLTPAEASMNPFVGATQGAVGKSPEGSKILYQRGQERIGTEKGAINRLLDTIYKEDKIDPQVQKLYSIAYDKKIPIDSLLHLHENEVINRAEQNLMNKPAFKQSLKGVPRDSVAYLDHVKRSLDDMVNVAERKGANSEARIIKDTRKKLLDSIDSKVPQYKLARQEAERKITRSAIENKLNEDQYKGTDFYNKVLKNDKNYASLLQSLRNVPEAQAQLKDMKSVFGNLLNPPTVRTAKALEATSMNKGRSDAQYIETKIRQLLSGKTFDKAAVELITDPHWAKQLKQVSKISNIQKRTAKFIDLAGRASAASIND